MYKSLFTYKNLDKWFIRHFFAPRVPVQLYKHPNSFDITVARAFLLHFSNFFPKRILSIQSLNNMILPTKTVFRT